MNEFESKLVYWQERQTTALERIAQLLEQALPQSPPNHRAILENFNNFDWSSINAEVELSDNYGVSLVIWNGKRYKRRSPNNAYGAVIFFPAVLVKPTMAATSTKDL